MQSRVGLELKIIDYVTGFSLFEFQDYRINGTFVFFPLLEESLFEGVDLDMITVIVLVLGC